MTETPADPLARLETLAAHRAEDIPTQGTHALATCCLAWLRGTFEKGPGRRNTRRWFLGAVAASMLCLTAAAAVHGRDAPAGKLSLVDKHLSPDLFLWTDTCNVYVLRDGDAAILVDLGDGSVLEHLREIGVHRVEWVLLTHHHREQCQGYARLKGSGAKIAAPEAERALLERPASFRKMKVSLGDAFTVHGASYVRPPIEPIAVDRGFGKMDQFTWHRHAIWCVETRGNSPGAMSYLLKVGGRWLAFSGDVMLEGARMHNWFDTEWDYGFASGIYAISAAAAQIEGFDPVALLPSHGPPVREPKQALREYQAKLRNLDRLLVRGYSVNRFAGADQDLVSRPSPVTHVWQITPHLVKFRGPDFWPNFAMVLSDSGHGLAVDCGLLDVNFLDMCLRGMQKCMGLKKIDAVVITHMHGDHILQAPHLREKWDAEIWTLDRVADKFEFPERFDYAAPIQAYGDGNDRVHIDRALHSGETLDWEGCQFTVDWMPGQTEFALCLHGTIDGRKVAFTGDNLFGNPADPSQDGHEAVMARNSGIFEEGYLYGAEYLQRLKPDLIVGGHSFVMDNPAAMIDRYRQWALDMRAAFQALSTDEDYRYAFDPFWVRAEPYRLAVKRGQSTEVTIHVRNFRDRPQKHRIEIHTPADLSTEPKVIEGQLAASSRATFPLRLKADNDAAAGVAIVAMDVTLDGQRYGEWFDFVVQSQ